MEIQAGGLCRNCPVHAMLATLKERGLPPDFVSLRQAISRLLLAKKAANLRQRYIDSLRQYLNQFARGREDIPLQNIGLEQLQLWFESRHESSVAQASNVGRLSSLFGYGVKQGWLTENPCRRLERPIIDAKSPGIHTVEQVKTLLKTALDHQPELIGYLAPLYFGGLRPNESAQLIQFEVRESLIEVTPEKCKTRRRRFIPINETLAAWLAVPGVKFGGEFASITLRRKLRRLKKLSAVPWPHDVLRHTFCSYALPQFGASKTAEWAGHSEQILFAHYRERVKPADVASFWSLRP